MKKISYFTKNHVLEITLILCTCVLIALFINCWFIWKDTTSRAVTTISLVVVQFITGCVFPLFSRKQILDTYCKVYTKCCLAVLVVIWGMALIMNVDYWFLFWVISALLIAGSSFLGILIICGIEILKINTNILNNFLFPH